MRHGQGQESKNNCHGYGQDQDYGGLIGQGDQGDYGTIVINEIKVNKVIT